MFSSIDDMVAEMTSGKGNRTDFFKQTGTVAYTAGNWYDLSMIAGNPVANTYTGTALNAQVPSDAGWGIYTGGSVSPDTKHISAVGAYATVATAVPSVALLVDICLYYPGINLMSTSAQTLTNSSTLTRYTTGAGLRAYMVSTTLSGTSASTPVFTMSYTNQAGTSGRSLGSTTNFTAGAANIPTPGKICHSGVAANNPAPFLSLASGDTGIRSVQSVQLTTAYTGATTVTGCLVLCKPLLSLPITTAGVAAERNMLMQIPSLPQVQDGACLAWLFFAGAATAASTPIMGYVETVWG